MLKETTAIVQKGIDEGKSVDQLVASRPLAKWDKWFWLMTTDAYVRQLYNALRASPRTRSSGRAPLWPGLLRQLCGAGEKLSRRRRSWGEPWQTVHDCEPSTERSEASA